jgi:hypothetical protein
MDDTSHDNTSYDDTVENLSDFASAVLRTDGLGPGRSR